MLMLQIISIVLLSVFMSLTVYVWYTTLSVRKDIDNTLAGYIVDANRDYVMRLSSITDYHIKTAEVEKIVTEKLDNLTSNKVKTFRDYNTGLLNAKALEIYCDQYKECDILHFSMIKVAGIESADKQIQELLKIESYAAHRVGIELYQEAYKTENMCDIYRIDYETFLMISIDSMAMEIMTNIKESLLRHNEVSRIFIGTSHRVTRKKELNKCIAIAAKKLKDSIEKST